MEVPFVMISDDQLCKMSTRFQDDLVLVFREEAREVESSSNSEYPFFQIWAQTGNGAIFYQLFPLLNASNFVLKELFLMLFYEMA